MKKITYLFVFILSIQTLIAQNNYGSADDAARITLATVVPDNIEGLSPSLHTFLNNKLKQITSKYGMGGASKNERFIMATNVQIITRDITPTAPPMHAYTLEVSFFIGDGIDGKLFASTTKTLKGVGETEDKACRSALKNIKATDPIFSSFIEEGKRKIIEYYNSQCDFMIKESEMLASKTEYDAAIYNLVSIPEVCKECYDKAMDKITIIYQEKIDRECSINFASAQNAWNENRDEQSAKKANEFLAKIDPNSKCFNDAQELSNQMYQEVIDKECSSLLLQAQTAWNGNRSEQSAKKANESLAKIDPNSKCFNDAQELSNQMHEEVIDKTCSSLLLQAQSAWSEGQNSSAAQNASQYLKQINPKAKCFPEAQILTTQIAERIKKLEKRDWDFQLKQYEDDLAFQKQKHEDQTANERARIEASKEIAIIDAENEKVRIAANKEVAIINAENEKVRIAAARDMGIAYGKSLPEVAYNLKDWL